MLTTTNTVTLTSPPPPPLSTSSSITQQNTNLQFTNANTSPHLLYNHLNHHQISPKSHITAHIIATNGTTTNNQVANNNPTAVYHPSYKDTRWLTLEVCREYQRNKCNRNENECKFAHPPAHVEIINGKVIACYDSLKSKCTRKEPPCKYLHPPQHLKDQLLQNGKNNLVLKQVALAMMQQHTQQTHHPHQQQTIITAATPQTATQYASYATNLNNSNQFFNTIPTAIQNGAIVRTAYQPVQMSSANGTTTLVPIVTANGFSTANLQLPQAIYATDPSLLQHMSAAHQSQQATQTNNILPPHQRTDRLTICSEFRNGTCQKSANECLYAHPPSHCPVDTETSLVTVCVDFIKGKCTRETCKYFHPPEHLVTQLKKQKLSNNAAAAKAAAAAAAVALAVNTNTLLTPSTAHYTYNTALPSYYTHSQHQIASSHLNVTAYQQHLGTNQSQNQSNTTAYHLLPSNTSGIQYAKAVNSLQNGINNTHHTNAAYLNSHSAQLNSQLAAISAQNTNLNTDDTSLNGAASYTLDATNNPFQIPFQILTPIYQHANTNTNVNNTNTNNNSNNISTHANTTPNAYSGNNTNSNVNQISSHIANINEDSILNQTNSDLNKAAASSSATANATANVVVDVVMPSKKRQHDAIEDFLPLQTNIYSQSGIKRAALTDSKTGMPVFQPIYHQYQQQSYATNLTNVHQAANALTSGYPLTATNFTMQYAPYPAQAFPIHYNGNPSGLPRL